MIRIRRDVSVWTIDTTTLRVDEIKAVLLQIQLALGVASK